MSDLSQIGISVLNVNEQLFRMRSKEQDRLSVRFLSHISLTYVHSCLTLYICMGKCTYVYMIDQAFANRIHEISQKIALILERLR